jgi:outer membrane protein assembly factor BamB
MKPFEGHEGEVLAYSSARQEILCGTSFVGRGFGLVIVDAKTGMAKDHVTIPNLYPFPFPKLRVDPSGRTAWLFSKSEISGQTGTAIWAVNLETRQVRMLTTFPNSNQASELSISADGTLLAVELFSVSTPEPGRRVVLREVRVYDTASGKVLSSVAGGEDLVLSESGRVYLVKKDGKHEIRESRTGQLVAARKFEGAQPEVDRAARSVVFGKDGRSVLFVWRQEDQKALWRWDWGSSDVAKVATFKATGSHDWIDEADGAIYTIGDEGSIGYDMRTGQARRSTKILPRMQLTGAAVSPRGDQVLGIGVDRSTREKQLLSSDMATGQVRELARLKTGRDVAFLDDRTVLVGGENGTLVKVDASSGTTSALPGFGEVLIDRVVASRSGRYVAIRGVDKARTYHLGVIATDSGRIIYSKTGSDQIHAMGFGDDEKRLVFGEKGSFVAVDLRSGQIILRKELKSDPTEKGVKWDSGKVNWVLPVGGSSKSLEIGVNDWVVGLIYEYAAGTLKLKNGNHNGDFNGSNPGAKDGSTAYFRVAARAPDGGKIAIDGRTPEVLSPAGTSWLSRHAELEGIPIALGAQGKDRFIVVEESGRILLYDRSAREPVLITALSSDNNWLSRVKGGYFAGTRGGAESLFFAVSSSETITIDSLFDVLYRPDFVAAAAVGDPQGIVTEAESKADIGTLLKGGLPPRATIDTPSDNSSADGETVMARARLVVAAGRLGRIEWRVNGVTRVSEIPAAANGARPGDTVSLEASLLLEPGSNDIELVAFNAANQITSAPARTTVAFGKAGAAVAPRLFVLSIGINEYWDSRLKLKFATRDAFDIAHSFEAAGQGLFEKTETWTVTDQKATREGIQAAFDEIARKIRSTDVFILFVAGHGKTENGRYYFLAQDFKYTGPPSIAEQGIGQSDWQAWLARIAARKSLLMYDTCESGTLTEDQVTRGFDRLAALDRLTRATGRSVLAAASDDGPALEGFEGHGVFAYSILEGLGADPNRSGLVQVTSLASYVGQRVPELSFGRFGIRQVPQMKLTGEDFSVGRAVVTLEKINQEFVSPQPTHVLIASSALFDEHGTEIGGEALPAGTLVRVVRTVDAFSEVARSGKKIGYLRSVELVAMQ